MSELSTAYYDYIGIAYNERIADTEMHDSWDERKEEVFRTLVQSDDDPPQVEQHVDVDFDDASDLSYDELFRQWQSEFYKHAIENPMEPLVDLGDLESLESEMRSRDEVALHKKYTENI